MTITLTNNQEHAIHEAAEVASGGTPNKLFVLGGHAGTGKSTILKGIADLVPGAIPCAYTGQAVDVMRRKGVFDARTIHSSLYTYNETKRVFELKEKEIVQGDYFLVDEASMLSAEMYRDMKTLGMPIIAVGDHGQLPPISKSEINLMERPNIVLDQIHRQGPGSDIIDLATWIRETPSLDEEWPEYDGTEVTYLERGDSFTGMPDVFIVGYNRTRTGLNYQARQILGLGNIAEPFAFNERIVCLRNDPALGVFNGKSGLVYQVNYAEGVKKINSEWEREACVFSAQVLWDGETEPQAVNLSTACLGAEKPPAFGEFKDHRGKAILCDYGYARTCHKSQGSEYGRVVVFNEAAPRLWDQRRWLYTAVTRASKHVTVFR